MRTRIERVEALFTLIKETPRENRRNHKFIGAASYKLGISERTIEEYLSVLEDAGKINLPMGWSYSGLILLPSEVEEYEKEREAAQRELHEALSNVKPP